MSGCTEIPTGQRSEWDRRLDLVYASDVDAILVRPGQEYDVARAKDRRLHRAHTAEWAEQRSEIEQLELVDHCRILDAGNRWERACRFVDRNQHMGASARHLALRRVDGL